MKIQPQSMKISSAIFHKFFLEKNNYFRVVLRNEQRKGDVIEKFYSTDSDSLRDTMKQIQSYNDKGYGVYFTVNGGSGKSSEIKHVNAWFMEVDNQSLEDQWAKIESFALPPSMITYSGGKSYHCYWFAKDGKVEDFKHIQLRLAKVFGGDEALSHPSANLRLFGIHFGSKSSDTLSLKNQKPQHDGRYCEVVAFSGREYSQNELLSHTPDINYSKTVSTVYDLATPSYDELRMMIQTKIDFAREEDTKTPCRCINPNHDDKSASAVFLWENGVYHCSGCGSKKIVAALQESDIDFANEIDFIFANSLYGNSSTDVISSIGKSYEEFLDDVRFETRRIAHLEPAPRMSFDEGFTKKAVNIAKETAAAAINDIGDISKAHSEDVQAVSMLFSYPMDISKAVAISAEPSFGKSTIMKHFGRIATSQDESFGAVYVVRTVEEVRELVNYFNGHTNIRNRSTIIDEEGFNIERYNGMNSNPVIATGLESWKAENCINPKYNDGSSKFFKGMCSKTNCPFVKDCPFIQQNQTQKSFPIVVMTHQRMSMNCEGKDEFFGRFGTFRDKENTHRRKVVIIDEKPADLKRPIVITYDLMKGFIDRLTMICESKNVKQWKAKEIAAPIKELFDDVVFFARTNYDESCDNPMLMMYLPNPIRIPHKTKDFIQKNLGYEDSRLIEDIEFVVNANAQITLAKHFGIKTVDNWKMTYTRDLTLNLQPMNVFILDGTSNISPDYSSDRFVQFKSRRIRNNSNVKVIQYDDSFGKTKIGRSNLDEVNKNFERFIRNRFANHEKILVMTTKEHNESLQNHLNQAFEGTGQTIKVIYSGSRDMKGSNKFADFTCFVLFAYAGLPRDTIVSIAANIQQMEVDENTFIEFESFHHKKQLVFKDDAMEAIKLRRELEDIIQAANRINRIRGYEGEIVIGLFNRNPLLGEMVSAFYEGSTFVLETVEETRFKKKSSPKYQIPSVAFEMLKESPNGKVKKSAVRDTVGISSPKFSAALKDYEIKEELKRLGIAIQGHSFVAI